MKAFFIRPINPTKTAYKKSFGFLPTPLGLLQLAGDVLSVEGTEARVVDMEADGMMTVESVVDEATKWDPDVVGITIHATAAQEVSLSLARRIKEQLKDTVLVAGGHHATFTPTETLKGGFDVVVLGEGDGTMVDLVHCLNGKMKLEDVKGIAYYKGGEIRKTKPRPLITNLDTIPVPAFHLVNREKYTFDIFGKGESVACIETSRGCPYACDFCSVTPTWGNKWRNKSVSRIMQEVKLVESLGYRWIFFVDDIFVVFPNIKQREKLFDCMINEGVEVKWIAQMRADITARNPTLIEKAANAGLKVAFLGVESGSEETLKKMHKGLNTSWAEKAVKVLDENGVVVLVGLILGAPYEGLKDMWRTVKFAYKLSDVGADGVQFSIYTPLPGTRVFVDAIKNGKLFTLDWSQFDLLTPVMRTRVHPTLIQLMQFYGNYSFYIRKWVRSKLLKTRVHPRKLALLKNAESYFLKRVPHFLKEIVWSFPVGLARTTMFYVKGGQPSAEKAATITEESSVIVYDDNSKNRYFLIDDK
ncbi:B12-binding domain-containing radical SAM protein [Sulfodiicoccus acidiphilus]|uniref:B12-binding domain-containing radical SAM protein n=1 Tax=Sulfodiicoccus acidiphilus TaxID=1670455 RepID=A0A348B2A2_9CREN|nr:radical SAM protein [Sulfodiicoccus acidiphilus]BBD72304.1 B12-binding domain-containing radical SAM protein [Sulfodiicoccus acidiphilus]GGT90399.1 B12-binding domain-containing radical SAM protein [Sulfodiicoccus acidiphilus]